MYAKDIATYPLACIICLSYLFNSIIGMQCVQSIEELHSSLNTLHAYDAKQQFTVRNFIMELPSH